MSWLVAFLGSLESVTSLLIFTPHYTSGFALGGFAYPTPYVLGRTLPYRALHLSSCVTTSLITDIRWHWNLNQLSIPYALRPRVRSRLTLGGRAFPRNPWASGGQDSHLPSRLLMPAFSLPSSLPLLPVRLLPARYAPLPIEK